MAKDVDARRLERAKALAHQIENGEAEAIDAEELKEFLISCWEDSRRNFDAPTRDVLLRDPKSGRDLLVTGHASAVASRKALRILLRALEGSRVGPIKKLALERWRTIGRPYAQVRLEITLDYLNAQSRARRRTARGREEVSTSDVLREDFSKTVNFDRILENPTALEKRAEITGLVEETVRVAKETIKLVGGDRTPTKRELKTALGLTRRSARRPRFSPPRPLPPRRATRKRSANDKELTDR